MGQDTSKHEIQKELERVKLYMSKVKSAEKTNTKPQNSPGFIVNKEVVHRLIKNSTGNGTSKIKSSTMTSQAVDNYLQTIKSEVEATEVAKIAKGDISDIQNESVIRDDQINSSKRSRESEDQTNIEPSAKRIVSDNSEVNNKKNNRAKKDKKKRQKKH